MQSGLIDLNQKTAKTPIGFINLAKESIELYEEHPYSEHLLEKFAIPYLKEAINLINEEKKNNK